MPNVSVLRKTQIVVQKTDFGELQWYASGAIGNSKELTVGRCVLRPGKGNPVHAHPNCEEVLHVERGRIRHFIAGQADVEMDPGDTIVVPRLVRHNATNIGTTDAVLLISFSSPDRQTKGE